MYIETCELELLILQIYPESSLFTRSGFSLEKFLYSFQKDVNLRTHRTLKQFFEKVDYMKWCKLTILLIIFVSVIPEILLGKTASPKTLTVQMNFNDSDGMLFNEKVIQTFVEIKNNSADTVSMQITWKIETDTWRPLMEMDAHLDIMPNVDRSAYCPWFELPGPGFYHISATITTEKDEIYAASKVVGIDPEKIPATTDAMDDFDSFWKESLRALDKIDPKFKVIPQKRDKKAKTKLFKIEMQSWNGLTMRGWLEVPKKRGKYPALLRVPGYNSNKKPIDKYDDLIVLSFNPRSHGESDDGEDAEIDMWIRGLDSEQKYYYRGAYLDCIRAVDFLESRKDVDQDRIAIWGGSQGGGFAFATAALDERIDLCIADIPWMCDWDNFFAITHWAEIGDWFASNPDQNWASMLNTLSYFDTKNMADRISCPVIMSIGLQDAVCPPSTSFATYNLINSPKGYTVYKHSGHWQPKTHYEDRFKWLRGQFNMD